MSMQDTLAGFLSTAPQEGQGILDQPNAPELAQQEVQEGLLDQEGGIAEKAPTDDFFGAGAVSQVTLWNLAFSISEFIFNFSDLEHNFFASAINQHCFYCSLQLCPTPHLCDYFLPSRPGVQASVKQLANELALSYDGVAQSRDLLQSHFLSAQQSKDRVYSNSYLEGLPVHVVHSHASLNQIWKSAGCRITNRGCKLQLIFPAWLS